MKYKYIQEGLACCTETKFRIKPTLSSGLLYVKSNLRFCKLTFLLLFCVCVKLTTFRPTRSCSIDDAPKIMKRGLFTDQA